MVKVECESCGYETEIPKAELGATAEIFGFYWRCSECNHENMEVAPKRTVKS